MTDKVMEDALDTGRRRRKGIPLSYRPIVKDNLQRNDLQDGCVVYNKEKGSVLALNISSSYYLTYCTGEYTLEQIAADSAAAMGIKNEQALKDVVSTINIFQENGLLEAG